MESPSVGEPDFPRGCSSMLKVLRDYWRVADGAAGEERRQNSSYGRRARKRLQRPLTPSEKAVLRAKRFRMINPVKHRDSMRKWKAENPREHCAHSLAYYHKHKAEIAEKRRVKRQAAAA